MKKEKDFKNKEIKKKVNTNTELKKNLVEYVGNKLNPKDKKITVEMIVEVMAQEFPEFILAIAEQNFIIGYEQALVDMESVQEDLKRKET